MVHQATGVLMAVFRIGAETAQNRLQVRAAELGVPLVELAERLIEYGRRAGDLM